MPHPQNITTMKKPSLVDVSVLILFFNRPEPLSQVFAQVRKARPARLFLYQDGPRTEQDLDGIMACRKVVDDIDWECEVSTYYQEKNQGCDPSEYISQKWAFSHTDKCVVLEDDDVPAVSFFAFCKELLDRYEHDPRVWMIQGFNPEEKTPDVGADYFFTTHFSIWGWASWRRVVDTWDEHYTWLDEAGGETARRIAQTVRDRSYRKDFMEMCRTHRRSGKAYYESIFWASLLLNGALCIAPTRNMVNNLGALPGSTHFGASADLLPRGYRRIFTMKRYEIPQLPLRHPLHVMENTAYRDRIYRIMGWNHPMIKVGRSLEELWLNLSRGNFGNIRHALVNRIKKTLGHGRHV